MTIPSFSADDTFAKNKELFGAGRDLLWLRNTRLVPRDEAAVLTLLNITVIVGTPLHNHVYSGEHCVALSKNRTFQLPAQTYFHAFREAVKQSF